MELASSFVAVVQSLNGAMTAPTWNNFVTLLGGWIFAPRRTITCMIETAGMNGVKHHSSFHRIFSAASWSLDAMGLLLLDLVLSLGGETVFLAIDDTLARKRGLKMFGAGMHYDPLISSRAKTLTSWGHSWVVLGVVICFPLWPGRPFCLPILFRLYLNKKRAWHHRRVYRTRPELAVEMVHLLCCAHGNRRFHLLADSSYGGVSVVGELPENCDLTSRLVLDARLNDALLARQPGQNGRPRRRGKRLPSPEQMLEQRGRRLALNIYGRSNKMRVVDAVARLHKVPETPVRVVVTEALTGGRGREAFYSTCADATAEQILSWYAWRWSIEVTFHDSKQHLGFEQPQGWTRQAVKRTAPVAMLLYSVIVYWFANGGGKDFQRPFRPWHTTQPLPSFRDMLVWLRRQSLRENVFVNPASGVGSKKARQTLERFIQLAA